MRGQSADMPWNGELQQVFGCADPHPVRAASHAVRQGVAMMVVATNIVGLTRSVSDMEMARLEDE
jgi:hypothetical protein